MTRDERQNTMLREARSALAPEQAEEARFWKSVAEALEDELHRLLDERRAERAERRNA